MSEVEKMYENAEPDRNCNLYKHFTECPMKHTQCEDCENFVYPPFTAEKQIELIKLLGSLKDYTVEIDKFKGVYYVGCREAGSNNKHWGSHNLFDEALAELVNDLWQNLTEEECKQIKEILE